MRVEGMVRQLVSKCGGKVHDRRLAAVVKVVSGVVEGGRLTPATVGRNLAGTARPKHGIKCVDRLLGNAKMVADRGLFYRSLAERLLAGSGRLEILIDWTQVGADVALVAAVPIGGRALPVYSEVHPLKKLGNIAVETRFLRALEAIVPRECHCVIVSDAGFKGPFFQAVRALGWDFLGRVRGTTKAVLPSGNVISKEELYQRAAIQPADLGAFELFVNQRIPCRLVLVRKRRKPGPKKPLPRCKEERELRQSALDPWLLATSLSDGDAEFIVGLYAKRMQIEETFRDAKNHRFGWSLGHVRLSTTQRMATLLLLAALAMAVMTLIGMTAERAGIHRRYQANTYRTRVLSFFVLACAIIHRGDFEGISDDNLRVSLATIRGAASA
jgi:hypothetical protein